MIRVDAIWLATEPMDMRAGTETALARVVEVFGAAKPHCAYLFANRRAMVSLHTSVGRTLSTEGEQINEAALACAPSGTSWDGIDGIAVQRRVRGLQARIVSAVQDGRHNKVKTLQWLLTHSFSGKALPVKRVPENKGKNTPGVDKVTWNTPRAKIGAIASLKRRGYSPLPLRRVLIPKKTARLDLSEFLR